MWIIASVHRANAGGTKIKRLLDQTQEVDDYPPYDWLQPPVSS